MNGIKKDPKRTGIAGPVPPDRGGKIIPQVGGVQKPPPPRPLGEGMPDWDLPKKPSSIDPKTVFSIESIPQLFETIERIMNGLSKLNVEFCLKSDKIPEVWLVPAYTSQHKKTRRELRFEDAAKLVVLVSAFNGEITEMKFLDDEN